jgi:aryl-alcohol dehydrogenase-like predicted oxidoreductase
MITIIYLLSITGMMIQGHATREGTERFKLKHEGRSTAYGHFKDFQGLALTSIGMGTYLGRADGVTDELVISAVNRSISSGAMNVIDTAINYRFQKAERSVGRALKYLVEENTISRDEVFISTKNGYLTHDADLNMDFWEYVHTYLIKRGVISPEDISSEYNCIKVSYLEDQLKRSLSNLGLECIDLIYLHNAVESNIHDMDKTTLMNMLSEAFKFYEQKRAEGIIRYYGMATWTCFRVAQDSRDYINLEDIVRLAEEASLKVNGDKDVHGLRFIQLPFNLMMHEAATLKNQVVNGKSMTLFEAAGMLRINIFTSVPLMQGRLLNSDITSRMMNDLSSYASRCLQFARSSPAIPLVGQKRPEHVEENLKVAEVKPLSEDEFNAILAMVSTV